MISRAGVYVKAMAKRGPKTSEKKLGKKQPKTDEEVDTGKSLWLTSPNSRRHSAIISIYARN